MYIMTICHWAILHYNVSFQTIAGRSNTVFWWFNALSEDQEKNGWIHQNYLEKEHHYYMKHFLLVTKNKKTIWGGGGDRVKILKTREQNIIHEAHNVDEWKYVRQMKTINHHWIQIKCWKKKKHNVCHHNTRVLRYIDVGEYINSKKLPSPK